MPVVNAVLTDPDTRALYLFPTKALAQDQLAELHDVATRLDDRFGVFTSDGDTPSDARKAIRERGHVILSNPDMLHSGILPHHTKWMRLLENLRYIVLDELHTYRGVYGGHVANVLRRLAQMRGKKPRCASVVSQDYPRPAAVKAGVIPDGYKGRFGFHNLRHSLATFFAASDVNFSVIQSSLRHAKPSTTARYTHRNNKAQMAAQAKFLEAIKVTSPTV